MPTGVENILGYKGDAIQGLGSNSSIPAISPEANTNVINKVGENLMLLSAERNKKLFDQKVKDRDTMLDLIDKGQINVGEHLEQDNPQIIESQKKADEAFEKLSANGINDIGSYSNYKKATKELSDITTHAAGRFASRGLLAKDLANAKTDRERNAIKKHIEEQDKKGFNDNYDPYQKLIDHNMLWIPEIQKGWQTGSVTPQMATTTTNKITNKGGKTSETISTTTKPLAGGKQGSPIVKEGATVTKDPSGRTVVTTPYRFDYNVVKSNAAKSYLENRDIKEDMDAWRNDIENDPYSAAETIKRINDRITDYNKENGFLDANDPNFVKPMTIGSAYAGDQLYNPNADVVKFKDENGKDVFKIKIPTAEFAAKTALAQHTGNFVGKDSQVDKDASEFNLKAQKQRDWMTIEQGKLKINQQKANALVRKLNSQVGKLSKPQELAKTKYNDILKISDGGRVDTDKLAQSRLNIAGIVYDANGKQTIGKVEPYYKIFGANGKEIDKKTAGITFSKYQTDVEEKKTQKNYNDWAIDKAKANDLTVKGHYDVEYYDNKGNQVRFNDPQSLPKPILADFNDKKKKFKGLTLENYAKIVSMRGEAGGVPLTAQFKGENGVGNINSIMEGEEYEDRKLAKNSDLYSTDYTEQEEVTPQQPN